MHPSHRRLLPLLGALFGLEFIVLAINPNHRGDWLLENVLTVLAIIILVASYRKLPLSRISYSMIFIFLCLHELGSHYTYAEVPYDDWFRSLGGFSLNTYFGWERNHFDRLVHFCYGLLLAYPIREVFIRIGNMRGFWAYFLPLDLTMSSSLLYELIEWGVAEVFGGDLGPAYLGTQGDAWDAHKDMALASLGALTAMTVTALIHMRLRRDFAREWIDSLRVKQREPLDEKNIQRPHQL